jgi:Dyp-type peroxidase family
VTSNDPQHPESRLLTEPPPEPLLEASEIQANIVPGFLKPFMAVSAFNITSVDEAKQWIARTIPSVTTLAQAVDSRESVRNHRRFRREPPTELNPTPGIHDAWTNLAFSYNGMKTLLGGDKPLRDFTDEAFVQGLAKRSSLLGDPVDSNSPGAPQNWQVGGPDNSADILVIFAADDEEKVDEHLNHIREAKGLTEIYSERAHKLDPIGREHFGFKDGVSQPGVRGRYAKRHDAFITPRTIAPDALPEAWLYGLPGQYLIYPGEFIFGYPGQGADPRLPGPEVLPGPAWARNGSYLVFRRLTQDVAGFRAFLAEQAAMLAAQPEFAGISADHLAAYLIGRWPSGAPLARSPEQDDPRLGADRLENNYFEFAADAQPLPLAHGSHTDKFPEAKGDPIGLICPMAAHIRKVNARSTANDQGGRRASFTRRILRRGLSFGDPLPSDGQDPAEGNRGLLFVCYQTSIVDQFEFLVSAWMGDPTNPRSPSGQDISIGQNGQPGSHRIRTASLLGDAGATAALMATEQFVTPTGGGYFFSPSITALNEVFVGKPPKETA